MFKLKEIWDKFLKSIFVDDCNCIICGTEIVKGRKYGLCGKCLEKIPINDGNICIRCGKSMVNEAQYCMECLNVKRHFDIARSSLIYKDDVQKLILDFKFYNKKWLAKYLAGFLLTAIELYKLTADYLVPTPLSKIREKERGYNQALLLSKELNKLIDIPIIDCLVKIKDNKQQSSLNGKERAENVIGVYKVTDKTKIKGKKLLVIDDIITTGHTADEIAKVLYKAGAERVQILTLASAEYKVESETYRQNVLDNYISF